MEYGALSLIPPAIAIILSIITRDVFASLFLGLLSAFTILAGGNVFQGAADTLMSLIKVFESNGNTIIILMTAFIGGLTYVAEKSGGIQGFANMVLSKKSLIKNKRMAELFAWLIGVVVFTSGTVSTLVTGTVSKPITDAFKTPHEKLAYIVHSTSTPVCVLLPLSGWGAFMIGLIQAQGLPNPEILLVKSIPLNFYALLAVFGVAFIILTGFDFGPMKRAEIRARETGLLDRPKPGQAVEPQAQIAQGQQKATSAANLLVPIGSMVAMILAGLLITGNGSLLAGNGNTAILWGVTFAIFVTGILYVSTKVMTYKEYVDNVFKGIGNLLSVSAILVLAFSFGAVIKELGTGNYLAGLFGAVLTPALLPAIIFLISCIISLATGTSMGTHALMFPLMIPTAVAIDANILLCIGAIFGGGIFGDHTSPISDTTIMTCMTTRCDIIDHITSQMPYTFTAAGITTVLYLIAGTLF